MKGRAMKLSRHLIHLTVAVGLALSSMLGAGHAQEPAKPFVPTVGQEGKDVIWVPTAQELVDRMLGMAKVTPQDYVIDLGSGDGRTVITAAKLGAKAHGIEYDEKMVELSRSNAEKENVAGKATFEKADIFKSDFSQATVITMFLLDELNLRLRPTLLTMKPGTRIVSNTFDMGAWKPDATLEVGTNCVSYCKAFLWIVPARVGGNWRLEREGGNDKDPPVTLALKQTFQMLSGTAKPTKGKATNITGASLRADEITFKIGNAEYRGRAEGDTMTGTWRLAGREGRWSATRMK